MTIEKVTFSDTDSEGYICLGGGTRVKRVAIIDVKVYAMALYVDASKAKNEKAKGLLGGTYARTLAIELLREVDGPTFYNALDEALKPRIAQIATNLATKEDEDGNFMASVAEAAEKEEEKALDELDDARRAFGGLKLKAGTKMNIKWTPASDQIKAIIEVGTSTKLEFESEVLAEALLDTYVGSMPVSPSAAESFKQGLAKL